MRVNVYRISTLISCIEAEPAAAWRAAVTAVKAAAHAEGVEGGLGYETPRGRVSFTRGRYRCVTERMVR